MALVIADRVVETSTTTGTGTLNLAGAVTGAQSFVAGVGDGNTTYYVIEDGTDWEVGLGTVTAGSPDTLSRDTIYQSSNSDAAVNWGSGTRNVFVALPANKILTNKIDDLNAFASIADQGDLVPIYDTSASELKYLTVRNLFATIDDISAFNDAPAGNDKFAIVNVSNGNANAITHEELMRVINLTEDTSPNLANDFLLIYDASAGQAKKVKPENLVKSLLHIQDQKTANTNGGTSATTTWNLRDLNTVVTNEITGASLSSNQITLPAGTYYIQAHAPAMRCNGHKLRLRNTTDSTNELIGSSEYTLNSADYGNTRSFLEGRFTIASEKVFQLEHYTETGRAAYGLGSRSNAGVIEIFADVKIWKES